MGMQNAVRLRLWDKLEVRWADEERYRAVLSPSGIRVAVANEDGGWNFRAVTSNLPDRFACYAELPLGEKPMGLAQADP